MASRWARQADWVRRHPGRFLGGWIVLITVLVALGLYAFQVRAFHTTIQNVRNATDRGDWILASELLTPCLSAQGNDSSVRLLAARVARHRDKLEEAQEHLDVCESLSPTPPQALRLERSLLNLHKGQLGEEEAFLRERLRENDPDSVEILDVLSASLILEFRVVEAQKCLDDLLERRPDHFPALVRRGWTARSMGDAWYVQAIEYYEKALVLRPETDTVRLVMAELLVAVGRYQEAREHLERLNRTQPGHPSVRFNLARALASLGEKTRAQGLFDVLIAENPLDWKSLAERGALAVQMDRLEEGETYLLRAHELAPPDAPLLTRLAECLQLRGKSAEARQIRDQADRLVAEFRRAEELGTLIREKSPDNADLRCELAQLLLRLKKHEDALHWFRTALEKDPGHRPTLQALIAFHEAAGEASQAEPYRRTLERLAPKEAEGSPVKGKASHGLR